MPLTANPALSCPLSLCLSRVVSSSQHYRLLLDISVPPHGLLLERQRALTYAAQDASPKADTEYNACCACLRLYNTAVEAKPRVARRKDERT